MSDESEEGQEPANDQAWEIADVADFAATAVRIAQQKVNIPADWDVFDICGEAIAYSPIYAPGVCLGVCITSHTQEICIAAFFKKFPVKGCKAGSDESPVVGSVTTEAGGSLIFEKYFSRDVVRSRSTSLAEAVQSLFLHAAHTARLQQFCTLRWVPVQERKDQ